jgi:hypothetical protein
MDRVPLKYLMKDFVNHSVPPICAMIPRRQVNTQAFILPLSAIQFGDFILGHHRTLECHAVCV